MTKTSRSSPTVTAMKVIPVAGYDSMLLNLAGAHAPFFPEQVRAVVQRSGKARL